LSKLNRIRTRFLLLILTGLFIAPLMGMSAALVYGLVSPGELTATPTLYVLGTFIIGIIAWAAHYFSRYFSPLSLSQRHGGFSGNLPDTQQRQLARFGRDYWSFFLLYALATPPLFFLAIEKSIAGNLGPFLQLMLLQLSVVTLVGLPTYQLALDQIGKLAGHLSLRTIQVSLKSKIMLLGGFSMLGLPVERFPNIAPPSVQITANYPGADAGTVADTVASVIEKEVNGVEGMIYMSSISANNGSMKLTVTFESGVDLDMATVLTQNRVSKAIPQLPQEVQRLGVTTPGTRSNRRWTVSIRSMPA